MIEPAPRANTAEATRARRALAQFVLVGLGLILLAALLPSSTLADRISVASFGGLPIALGALRPSGFWDVASLRGWRGACGDTGVRIIYVGFGVAWIVAALAGKI